MESRLEVLDVLREEAVRLGNSGDTSSCSGNRPGVFGLMFGDPKMFVPSLPPFSKSKLGISAPDDFLLCLGPGLKRSAGAFGCGRLSVAVQLGCGEEYGGKLEKVTDRTGGLDSSIAL